MKQGNASGQPPGKRPPIPLAAIFEDPRARTATIPIVLWVCAAVVAHIAGGGGAMEAAEMVHERDELKAAVRAERAGLRPNTTEVELLTDNTEPTPQQVEPPKEDVPGEAKNEGEPDPEAAKADPSQPPKPPPPVKPEPAKVEPPKVEPPKPEPPKPEPPKPKPPPLKPLAPAETPPAPPAPPPPPPPPPMEADKRIAVRQPAKKDQEDNPTANRIADDANHVEKETMARARSQDQDNAKPTMGASKGGPKDEIGNDKDQHSGSGESHKGDDKHAPGEAKTAATDSEHESPRPPVPPTPNPAGPPPSVPGMQNKGGAGAAAQPAAPPPSPGGAGPASPEVVQGEKGTYALDPANPGGDGKSRLAGRKRAPAPFQTPVHVGAIGLGGSGLPGGPQLNLNMAGVEKAVGKEELKRERAADGAARLAAHRGQGPKNKFEKFRPAIENYEPAVELGNTTALNAARSPFATYLNTIHNRIHPIFAEEFLEALNSLPKGHTMNQDLVTHLEIVLDKDTGKLVRMGVTKSSGVTAFDIAALSSVDRAGPYGKVPNPIIASPDGNVYLHWEFHRDPVDACTTRNARPFLLKEAPKKSAAPVGPVRAPAAKPRDDGSAPSGPLVPIHN